MTNAACRLNIACRVQGAFMPAEFEALNIV